jgi:hypothetical protein
MIAINELRAGEVPTEAADEFLFLAKRIPDRRKRRILGRPNDFRKLTGFEDKALARALRVITERAFSQNTGSVTGLYTVTGRYNEAPAAMTGMAAAGQGNRCKR